MEKKVTIQSSTMTKSNVLMFVQIRKNREADRLVDVADPSFSNWMRWVNCARAENEQNLIVYQVRLLLVFSSLEILFFFFHFNI